MEHNPSKPHGLAHHIIALFRSASVNDMMPVKLALEQSVKVLQTVRPTKLDHSYPNLDLTDPNDGISFAIEIVRGNYSKKVKDAGCLLRTCLHALMRGKVTEFDKQDILIYVAALSGYVPDHNAAIAKRKRKSGDALDRGIQDSFNVKPPLKGWLKRLYWLRENAFIKIYDEKTQTLIFTDSKKDKHISVGTFQNRITKVKKIEKAKNKLEKKIHT